MCCDEEMTCCLKHIYTTWNAITLGQADIREALDVQTVENLHLRAPIASIIDRHYINQQMDRPPSQSGLFPGVEDREKRSSIKRALLGLEGLIPTIKAFHENCIYLRIGANIIHNLLLDEKPKSTYEAMCDHWTAAETTLEEFREGAFREVTLERPDLAARFCFIQVLLAIFRQFPNLSNDSPRKEPGSRKRKRDSNPPVEFISGSVNPAYRNKLLWCAHSLGFKTRKITNGLRNVEDQPGEVSEPFILANDGEIIKRRSGTPFTNAYKEFRTQLFLPNLHQVQVGPGLDPSVMFVQRDLLNAFFGWAPGGRDFALSALPIPLSDPVPSLRYVLPHLASSSRANGVASPEHAALVERQTWSTNQPFSA